MSNEKNLAIFENFKIRRHYDEDKDVWYFSVIDIVQALIQQPDYQAARNYWKVLKSRLSKEGSQVVTDCNRLKMVADLWRKHGRSEKWIQQRMMGQETRIYGVAV